MWLYTYIKYQHNIIIFATSHHLGIEQSNQSFVGHRYACSSGGHYLNTQQIHRTIAAASEMVTQTKHSDGYNIWCTHTHTHALLLYYPNHLAQCYRQNCGQLYLTKNNSHKITTTSLHWLKGKTNPFNIIKSPISLFPKRLSCTAKIKVYSFSVILTRGNFQKIGFSSQWTRIF